MSMVMCDHCEQLFDCKHDDPDCFGYLNGKETILCEHCRDDNEQWRSMQETGHAP